MEQDRSQHIPDWLTAAAVSLPACAAIGYVFGTLGAGGLPGPDEWPPVWWPFSGAARSCAGLVFTIAALVPCGWSIGYWKGMPGLAGLAIALALLTGLLVPAIVAGATRFATSNLYPSL